MGMSASEPKTGTLGRQNSALSKVVTRYFAGLVVLALLSAASFAVIRTALNIQASNAHINRLVFSQSQSFEKIGMLSRALIEVAGKDAVPEQQVNRLRTRMRDMAAQVQSNMALMFELERLRQSFWSQSRPIVEVYHEPPHNLEAQLNAYLKHIHELAGLSTEQLANRIEHWGPSDIALIYGTKMRQSFEAAMSEAHEVSLYDLERLNQLIKIITLITLVVLITEALFLFLPLVKKLRHEGEQIKIIEAKLRRQASEDQLTQLANRSTFYECMHSWIERATNQGTDVCLIVFDLDRFKPINDTLGHQTGDQLLEMTAQRAKAVLRPDQLIARLGGDEFAVLSRGSSDADNLEDIVRRLAAAIEVPVKHGDWEIRPSATFGSANFPEHAKDSAALFAAADAALYTAKKEKTPFHFYNNRMRAADEESRQIALDLRQAIPNGELAVFYQPQFDISSVAPIGFEALVRWWHPSRGLLSASEFVPVAERLGLMPDLTTTVVETVTADIRKWLDLGRDPGIVGINLPEEMFAMGIAEPLLDRCLDTHRIPYDRICIEVTEDVFLNRASDKIAEVLSGIRSRGMRVAFDDFGTGYASLSHLKNFPFDDLKIDRSFVFDIGKDEKSAEIVRALIGLAKNLNKGLIAEGIETREQLKFLDQEGCAKGQGFIFSKPMPFSSASNFTVDAKQNIRQVHDTPGSNIVEFESNYIKLRK